jgi:hypothetical protein
VFNLPFQEKSFDVLVDFGCLHHVKKRFFQISRLDSDAPAVRGYYILSCFSTEFEASCRRKADQRLAGPSGHYDRFRKQDFKTLFSRNFDQLDYNRERDGSYVFHQVLMRRKD